MEGQCMDFFDTYLTANFFSGLQNFVVALIVLLIGWLIAKLIANGVEKAVKKTNLDEKLLSNFREGEASSKVDSSKVVGKVVYYILLLVVFVLFFNILNLNVIANPLADLISIFLSFIPILLKAALILVFAFILGIAAQWIVVSGGKKARIQELFVRLRIADTVEKAETYITTAGKVVFYVILLLFIPGVLEALSIYGVAEPFSGVLSTVLAFIPKLIAALIVFAIGWYVAKFIKNIVINLLKTVGTEKLVNKLNIQKLFEGTSLAAVVGNILFVLMMIPITISALEKLELTGITEPAIGMLNQVMEMIPYIIIAVAIILVGIWAGKFLGRIVGDFLARLGFNNITANMHIGNKKVESDKMLPSTIVGYIVQVLVVFFLTVQALSLVKLDFLVDIAGTITAYLPNVLAAVILLGIALIIANIVEKVLLNLLSGPAIRILAGFAKYAIMALAVFMALTQLGIATSIVASAFTLILGALALAFGLAFGLGGKDFAKKYLDKFDKTIEETEMKDKDL